MDLDYLRMLTDKKVKIKEHTQYANPYIKEFNITYKLKGVTVNLELTYNRIRNEYCKLVVEVGNYCAGYHMSYTPFFKDALSILLDAYPEIHGICEVFREDGKKVSKEREKSIQELLKKAA